jgi:excisionase family DNA binding protein
MPMAETRTYNAGEAAKKVGRAYSTIREHIRQGSLHAERHGRQLLINESELCRLYPHAFRDTADGGTGDTAGGESEGADGDTADTANGPNDSDGGHIAEATDSAGGQTNSADGDSADNADGSNNSDGGHIAEATDSAGGRTHSAGGDGADNADGSNNSDGGHIAEATDIAGGRTHSAGGDGADNADGSNDSDGGHIAEATDSAGGRTHSADGDGAVLETARPELGPHPFAIEVEVLRSKLESLEREHETTYQALMAARDEALHLRGLTTQQADTVQNLAEEIKGLTIALHHGQGQQRELQANLDDARAEVQARKRGLFGRMFRRKTLHRVGPS